MRTFLLLVLYLAACAGDDGGTDTAASSTSTTSSSATTSTTTGGMVAPLEGIWTFTLGAEVARTCTGTQKAQIPSETDTYRLEVGADDSIFTLTYPESQTTIHTCTRVGAPFECPLVMIGGDTCESWDVGLKGAFTSSTQASGELTWRFTQGVDELFCDEFGDVSPCTVTADFTALRT